MTPPSENNSPGLARWFLIVGAIGFAAGFLGPIALNPDANQGPLVGIFITGPGGAVLGLILYGISRALRISGARQWQLLWTASALLAGVTLFTCLPPPALRGELIDAQVQGCERPAQRADAAIEDWKKEVSNVTWAAPRPGWQEQMRRNSEIDDGAVLNVVVARRNKLYVQRKPWNKGRIAESGWQSANEVKSYYVQFPGACSDFPTGQNAVRFAPYDISPLEHPSENPWPPTKVSYFLDLAALDPVPDEHRKFVGK